MGRTIGPRNGPRSIDAELSDPALAYLFGPAVVPIIPEPAPAVPPVASPLSLGGPWTLAQEILAADETLVRLEDGGIFQIREVQDGSDFEIFVEEEESGPPAVEPGGAMNLDHFRAEFEADLAVFEGIPATTKGGPAEPDRPRVLSNPGGRCRA